MAKIAERRAHDKPAINPLPAQSPVIKRSLSVILASFIVFAGLTAYAFFTATEHDQKSFLAISVKKHKRLNAAPSPRVIITGGSNVTLGLDSAALEKWLGMPVVATSLNTLVGLEYSLQELKNNLRPGDIVVVAPEYEVWTGGYGGTESLLMMPSLIPEAALWAIPSYCTENFDCLRFAKEFHSALKERFKRLLNMKDGSLEGDFRAPGTFNDRCDFIQHLDLKPRKFDLTDAGLPNLDTVAPVYLEKFESFVKDAKVRGARVILVPPVTTKTFAKLRKSQLETFWKLLSTKLSCQTISDFSAQVLPDDAFWDCKYHPLRAGREKRTAALGKQLSTIIKNRLQ